MVDWNIKKIPLLQVLIRYRIVIIILATVCRLQQIPSALLRTRFFGFFNHEIRFYLDLFFAPSCPVVLV